MNKWESYQYIDGDGWAGEYLVVGIRNAYTKERICSGIWAGRQEVEQIVKAHNDEIEARIAKGVSSLAPKL